MPAKRKLAVSLEDSASKAAKTSKKEWPPFTKCFLRTEGTDLESADDATVAAVEAFRETHQIQVFGSGIPAPLTAFEATVFAGACHRSSAAVHDNTNPALPSYRARRHPRNCHTPTAGLSAGELRAAFTAAGFKQPTPVQAQAWPLALSGRDVTGLAETGSGKTLAYALPAVVHAAAAVAAGAGGGPVALVVAPTRELAMQIDAAAARFCAALSLGHLCVYGGAPKAAQARALRAGAPLLTATPGRLIDLLAAKACSLDTTTFLVLDEADRLLSMGFEAQVRAIVAKVRLFTPAPRTGAPLHACADDRPFSELSHHKPGASQQTLPADPARPAVPPVECHVARRRRRACEGVAAQPRQGSHRRRRPQGQPQHHAVGRCSRRRREEVYCARRAARAPL